MRNLKQSSVYSLMVFMTDSADHVTGKAGLTLTVTASKAGAAFASISPTVTDRGNGWYSLAFVAANTNTLGDLALHITGVGADPADVLCQIVAGSLDADVSVATKILRNKLVTDPATGTMTVYDDDGTTPLFAGTIYKDAAGTTPYNGTGAERRERLV